MTSTPAVVSAVVCTLNSIESIEQCLRSLREVGVREVIVVDADSTDGTRAIATRLADEVLTDPGIGLGTARNVGIARTTGSYVLNMGSDNVMPPGQLELMLEALESGGFHGVGTRTIIEGSGFVARGLNNWRLGRFIPGEISIIGTPTLFVGDVLRGNPFDVVRRNSDDSELCERWTRDLGARFAISDGFVWEIGKTTWSEIVIRCRMYGQSDYEVFRHGSASGWTMGRRIRSFLHPLRVDFVLPLTRLPVMTAIRSIPFLAAFTSARYFYWVRAAIRGDFS